MSGFLLGHIIDPGSGDKTGDDVAYDPSDLTTHGVIVGMTGSGKTGLGVILLEEALSKGLPTLIIDPKGDMGNLHLLFPEFAGSDFEPWVSPDEARREGMTTAELGTRTAEKWKKRASRVGTRASRSSASSKTKWISPFTRQALRPGFRST